jgi:hypothetical protein
MASSTAVPVPGRVLQLEQGGIQDAVLGVTFDVPEGLAFVGGEGGDVDQADDVAGVGCGVGDDRTAVGVTDGEHRSGDLPDGAGNVGSVGADAAQRVGDGLNRDPGGLQLIDHVVPA